jgi:ER membrane protein complex subunit 1
VSLSGSGGAVLRRFDYSTGQLVLEKRLQTHHESHLLDSGDFGDGTAIAFMEESRDIVALTSGHAVRRIEETGRVLWFWESLENP